MEGNQRGSSMISPATGTPRRGSGRRDEHRAVKTLQVAPPHGQDRVPRPKPYGGFVESPIIFTAK